LHLNTPGLGTVTLVKTKTPGSYLRITSQNINYHFPSRPLEAISFWLMLLLALVLFYITLKTIIVKLFSISMPDLSKWNVFDDTILANTNLNNLVFIIGMPGSGKLTRVLEKIKNKQICYSNNDCYNFSRNDDTASDVFVVELMNIPDSGDREKDPEWIKYEQQIFDKKNRLLIFNHFEYNIQDGATSRLKLNLLEKVMMQNNSRVIILSTIHPVAFLDSIYDHSFQSDAKAMPGQDLERWHVLLGHFRIIVFPLQEELSAMAHSNLEQLVYDETGRTHFLNKIQGPAIAVGNAMANKYGTAGIADELAVKLKMTAHYFYMYMWQSLTKEEKFILYDLAEDNLVNSYDDYNLNMLICKGIISRKNGSLKIFNNGFRNFILSAIGNIEAMKIKSQIQDNGNWNQVKYPLYIVFIAIIIFLFSSQQEAYTRLLTYAAALGTAIPALLKVFSLFDGTKQKSSEPPGK
jgi:hypothetical protein